MSKKSVYKVVIATGGTGGHVFPAEALASELLEQSCDVFFLGGGLENNRYFHRSRFQYEQVSASRFFRANFFAAFYQIIKGIYQSFCALGKLKPELVIGFGSYYTFPVLAAAWLKKIPIVLFEPDVLPGKVNQLFSRVALLSTVQFAKAGKWLHGQSMEVKMPTSKEARIDQGVAREYFYLDPTRFTFLVFGGSQGAASINRIFSEAACGLKNTTPFQVIHVTGRSESADKLRATYADAGIPACVKSFEEQMKFAWDAATVAFTRAGAGTIAEHIQYEVPAILVPFPKAACDHQTKNAEFVEENVKGSITYSEDHLTVAGLKNLLTHFLNSDKKEKMREAILAFKEREQKADLSAVIMALLTQEVGL